MTLSSAEIRTHDHCLPAIIISAPRATTPPSTTSVIPSTSSLVSPTVRNKYYFLFIYKKDNKIHKDEAKTNWENLTFNKNSYVMKLNVSSGGHCSSQSL